MKPTVLILAFCCSCSMAEWRQIGEPLAVAAGAAAGGSAGGPGGAAVGAGIVSGGLRIADNVGRAENATEASQEVSIAAVQRRVQGSVEQTVGGWLWKWAGGAAAVLLILFGISLIGLQRVRRGMAVIAEAAGVREDAKKRAGVVRRRKSKRSR